ncbi:hypothetical protein [Micrococcus luteus]|uniref:hypothetical protein n=1 Tax=Micrococcus luteus TaxID=1270 RepID=UPI00192E5888
MTVVGDSSALGSTSLMNLEMPGITVDAKEDRTFAEGLTRLGQLKAAGRLRDIVVLGLGVNTGGTAAAQARQAMDLVGPDRELVLVTASGPVAWRAFTEQAMRDLAARYPGRVAVTDWEAASRYVTDFRADRIHPRAQGLSVDAQLVRLAADRATGVPLAQLLSLNGPTLSTVLHPGQVLRIRCPLTPSPRPPHPVRSPHEDWSPQAQPEEVHQGPHHGPRQSVRSKRKGHPRLRPQGDGLAARSEARRLQRRLPAHHGRPGRRPEDVQVTSTPSRA